jgi:hypothetical protein
VAYGLKMTLVIETSAPVETAIGRFIDLRVPEKSL